MARLVRGGCDSSISRRRGGGNAAEARQAEETERTKWHAAVTLLGAIFGCKTSLQKEKPRKKHTTLQFIRRRLYPSHTTRITFKIFILTHQATHELSIAHTGLTRPTLRSTLHFKMLTPAPAARTSPHIYPYLRRAALQNLHTHTRTTHETHHAHTAALHTLWCAHHSAHSAAVLFGRDATRS